jgi:hypothetical protein
MAAYLCSLEPRVPQRSAPVEEAGDEEGGQGNENDPENGRQNGGKKAKKDNGEGDAGQIDDVLPEVDIKGADGEYPTLPPGHQPRFITAGSDFPSCYWGGVRWTQTDEAWKRLLVPVEELEWNAGFSASFRVVENHVPNTTAHLFHAGPHLSMTFDITQQNNPDEGDEIMRILLFLTHMVNSSSDLRSCIVKTPYTELDINPSKGKGVRGLFYHGGRKQNKGGGVPREDAPEAVDEGEPMEVDDYDHTLGMFEVNPLSAFVKILPVTFDVNTKEGARTVVRTKQSLFAIVTIVPAPGVDVFRCLESVCRECPYPLVRDERINLFAKLRMHEVNVCRVKTGVRTRRIPLDGVNQFVRDSHELQTANKIKKMLQKVHGNGVTDVKIVGLAYAKEDEEKVQQDHAIDMIINDIGAWRTKFTSAIKLNRHEVSNTFPWVAKMPVWKEAHENAENPTVKTDKFGYIEGAITMEFYRPLDDPAGMKWSDFSTGGFPEAVQVQPLEHTPVFMTPHTNNVHHTMQPHPPGYVHYMTTESEIEERKDEIEERNAECNAYKFFHNPHSGLAHAVFVQMRHAWANGSFVPPRQTQSHAGAQLHP